MYKSESYATFREITFLSDGFTLKGKLHLPLTDQPPVVIGSHGLFSTSDSQKQVELAKQCNKCGIAYFRFDHRGCGQSEGILKDVTSLEARYNDLMSAVKVIQKRKDTGNKIGLFGSSMGGAVCISVAAQLDVASLVTFAAPVRSSSIIDALEKSNDSTSLRSPFYKKNLHSDISDKLSTIHHILIFHGESDNLVPPSNAREIYERSGKPKKLLMQRGGDHRMSKKEHQENFIKDAVSWFKNCFEGTLNTI